jgi:hypothetical protein
MTICDTLADGHFGKRADMAMAFADILNEEALELEAAGVDTIQFDEPAFNVFMDDVKEWGVEALERAARGLKCTTAVHICYGYGIEANIKWKETLGSEWRQYEEIFPALNASKINQVSLECANSHVPISLIGLLPDKDLLVGCIDVASDEVETPEAVAATIERSAETRRRRTHLSLHQLRHGAPVARCGGRKAGSPRRRRGAGAQTPFLRRDSPPELMTDRKEPEIYVDADACPVKEEILKVAERHRLAVTFVANGGLRPSRDPMIRNVIVSNSADAADDWIAENAGETATSLSPRTSRWPHAASRNMPSCSATPAANIRRNQSAWRSQCVTSSNICAKPARIAGLTALFREPTALPSCRRSTGFAAAR